VKTLVCIALGINVAAAQIAAPLPAAGNVTLPLDEYNRMLELAARPAKKSDGPPVPFAIQRAEMKLVVAGGAASGTVQLEGQVFATGAVKVPLIAGMTVFDAHRQSGTPPLLWDGASDAAVLNGPADFNITLDVGMAVTVEPGRASVSIPALAAGAARLTLVIPGDNTSVTLRNGLILSRVPTGGKTPRHFTLDPTGKWLFAANQDSNSITVFSVDPKNGHLKATSHVLQVATPVCVVFVPAN